MVYSILIITGLAGLISIIAFKKERKYYAKITNVKPNADNISIYKKHYYSFIIQLISAIIFVLGTSITIVSQIMSNHTEIDVITILIDILLIVVFVYSYLKSKL